MSYQPDASQVAGSIGGAIYCMYVTSTKAVASVVQSDRWEIIESAVIGATIGFVVTAALRLLWDNLRAWLGKKYPFFRKK